MEHSAEGAARLGPGLPISEIAANKNRMSLIKRVTPKLKANAVKPVALSRVAGSKCNELPRMLTALIGQIAIRLNVRDERNGNIASLGHR